MLFWQKRKYENITQLVLACQQNDSRAQSIFYDRYKNKMMQICRRYSRTTSEAEDIFQDAFVKIFKEIHQIKNVLATDSWVKVIVVRTAVSHFRKNSSPMVQISLDESEALLESQDYENILSQIDLQVLLEIISNLPSGYRTVLNLYLIDGYSHEEIGKMLSITAGSSKSQMYRARNLLIKRLEQQRITIDEKPGRRS